MANRPYNKGRLSEAFDNAIANSRDSRIEDFYGTDLDTSEIMDRSEHLAGVILDGVKDVVSDESVARAQEEFESLFSDPSTAEKRLLLEHVFCVIDERIGHEIVSMQASAEYRFKKLVLIGKKALTDLCTTEYLHRVSQCYLFGFDEQCVIMCRSALEAAFLQSVPDHVCEEVPEVRDRHRPGNYGAVYYLSDRMDAAGAKGIANARTLKLARSVNEVANRLIHPNRSRRELDDETMDMIVMKTIQVVQELANVPAE
jgi:hypothetical protein